MERRAERDGSGSKDTSKDCRSVPPPHQLQTSASIQGTTRSTMSAKIWKRSRPPETVWIHLDPHILGSDTSVKTPGDLKDHMNHLPGEGRPAAVGGGAASRKQPTPWSFGVKKPAELLSTAETINTIRTQQAHQTFATRTFWQRKEVDQERRWGMMGNRWNSWGYLGWWEVGRVGRDRHTHHVDPFLMKTSKRKAHLCD